MEKKKPKREKRPEKSDLNRLAAYVARTPDAAFAAAWGEAMDESYKLWSKGVEDLLNGGTDPDQL